MQMPRHQHPHKEPSIEIIIEGAIYFPICRNGMTPGDHQILAVGVCLPVRPVWAVRLANLEAQ
jgi:hypothetical protein